MPSTVLKFAYDTKVLRKVKHNGDKQHLQNDLDKLVKWSDVIKFWEMSIPTQGRPQGFFFQRCKHFCSLIATRNLYTYQNLTRLPSQTKSSRWQVDKEAIGLSRVQPCYHLCIARPYDISVNSMFKHIHTTNINTLI